MSYQGAGATNVGYRLYYCDLASNLEVTAQGARRAELDEILGMMDRVLREPGHFLGVIDDEGGILQFLVHDDESIGVEIPDPGRRGHYGKRADLEECKRLISSDVGLFRPTSVAGLRFEKW